MNTTDASRATAEPMPVDPLIIAINSYRTGMAAYDGSADHSTIESENAAIEVTYGPPMAILEAWDQPAVSREGALEALRFALEELSEYTVNEMLPNSISAALAYFEREGGDA